MLPASAAGGMIASMLTAASNVGGTVPVAVDPGSGEPTVDVAAGAVGDPAVLVAVPIGAVGIQGGVGESGVPVAKSVGSGVMEGVAVMKIGLPYSLQPRSGAAPA